MSTSRNKREFCFTLKNTRKFCNKIRLIIVNALGGNVLVLTGQGSLPCTGCLAASKVTAENHSSENWVNPSFKIKQKMYYELNPPLLRLSSFKASSLLPGKQMASCFPTERKHWCFHCHRNSLIILICLFIFRSCPRSSNCLRQLSEKDCDIRHPKLPQSPGKKKSRDYYWVMTLEIKKSIWYYSIELLE